MWNAHENAKRIAQNLKEHGGVSDIEFSTNRNGDKSAYFTFAFPNKRNYMDIRVSDHFGNPDYITAHANIVCIESEKALMDFIKERFSS